MKQDAIFAFSENEENYSVTEGNILITSPQSIDNTLKFEENISEPTINDKYKNSGLSKQKSLELFSTLEDFMKTNKPYQNTELTLFTLAKQLSIHPNHLSQIINQHHNQNFFDYINEYRVNEVKEALLSGKYDTHSLLGIAFECGFNSKASFNRAFKKFTGLTPSEFRNKSST